MEKEEVQALWSRQMPIGYRFTSVGITLFYAMARLEDFSGRAPTDRLKLVINCILLALSLLFLATGGVILTRAQRKAFAGEPRGFFGIALFGKYLEYGGMRYQKHLLWVVPGILIVEVIFRLIP